MNGKTPRGALSAAGSGEVGVSVVVAGNSGGGWPQIGSSDNPAEMKKAASGIF